MSGDDFDNLFGTSDDDSQDSSGFGEPEPAKAAGRPRIAPGDDPFADDTPTGPYLDLDLAFAASMLHNGRQAVREAASSGVTLEALQGDGKRVYQFVLEYLGEHGATPTTDLVLSKLGLVLPDSPPDGPPAYWVKELMGRGLHTNLQGKLEHWTGHLERKRPQEAFEDIQSWVREQSAIYAPVTVQPLYSHAEEVKLRYLRRKAGERGIQTPWPTVNELTFGMYPEQVWLLVARSGVGKTWMAIMMAAAAARAGHRVLFATTEMPQVDITQRFISEELKLPYQRFQAGKLDEMMEEAFFAAIETLQKNDLLYVVGGDFDFRPQSYEAAIERVKPTMSILDGAYLLKVEGKSRQDAAAEAFNEIKRIGKRQKIGQAITSQFNREVKTDDAKGAAQEKVALSDAAVWNASVIMAAVQTKDMRRDRVLQAKLLKNREGPLGETMTFNWDFETMDFSEQIPDQDPTGDQYGSGVPGPAEPLAGDPFGPHMGPVGEASSEGSAGSIF